MDVVNGGATVEEAVDRVVKMDDFLFGEEEETDYPLILLMVYMSQCCPHKVKDYYEWLTEEIKRELEKRGEGDRSKARKRLLNHLKELSPLLSRGAARYYKDREEYIKWVEDVNKSLKKLRDVLSTLGAG